MFLRRKKKKGVAKKALLPLSNKDRKKQENINLFLQVLANDEKVSFDIRTEFIFISYEDFSRMSETVKEFVKVSAPIITVSSSVESGSVSIMDKIAVLKRLKEEGVE